MYVPKKVILLVLGGLGVALAAAAAWAAFTASATNPSNTFSHGTLVLSVKKGSGSTCFSTGGGNTDTNSNSSCENVFNESVKKPGDSTVSETITVKNEGSIDASIFRVFSTACSNADNGESYHGTGNPCSKIQLYLQGFSDSGATTPSTCLYGGGNGTTCDFSDATKTIGDFATNYPDAANGLSLGGLTAGTSRYFKIGVMLPANANNSYQGRKATWDVNWYIGQ